MFAEFLLCTKRLLILRFVFYFRADGSAAFTTQAPDTITSWVATAFSVNPTTGLGISDTPAKVYIYILFKSSLYVSSLL